MKGIKMEELNLKLELTVADTNNVLAALGKMPFEQVAGLVDKIRNQAVPQVQRAQAETSVESTAE